MKKTNKKEQNSFVGKFSTAVKKNKTVLIFLGIVFSLLLVPLILFMTFFNNDSVQRHLGNKQMGCSRNRNTECPAKRNEGCNCNRVVTGGCPYRIGN